MKVVKTYKGFKLEFVLPDALVRCLAVHGVEPSSLVSNEHEWFEVTLFDLIDENRDGIPDERFGKRFQIFFYSMVLDSVGGPPREIPVGERPIDTSRLLCDGARQIGPMRLRYSLLMKTDHPATRPQSSPE